MSMTFQRGEYLPPKGEAVSWQRYKFPGSLFRFGGFIAVLAFLGYSMAHLGIDLKRILGLFGRLGDLIADRYYPPEMDYVMQGDYLASVFETVQMAYLGGLFGILLAIPLAWLAAYNVTIGRRTVIPWPG